ncbi:MAG: hypothetical protein EXR76_07660 [Myxococcales bacterium]|nr:hypothetical protein [Myxococcales bacterium]
MNDPCASARCEVGFACVFEACVPDPCAGVRCPVGQVCTTGEGDVQCLYAEQLPPRAEPLPLPPDDDLDRPDVGFVDQGLRPADSGRDQLSPSPAGDGCGCDMRTSMSVWPSIFALLPLVIYRARRR